MKRIKSKCYLQIGIILASALLFSACAATKTERPYPPVSKPPLLIARAPDHRPAPPMSELRMTTQGDRDFNICAGDCLSLILALVKPEEPRSFSSPQQPSAINAAEATASAPLPALDQKATPAPIAGNNDNVEPVKKADAPVGAYSQQEKITGRTLPSYERK